MLYAWPPIFINFNQHGLHHVAYRRNFMDHFLVWRWTLLHITRQHILREMLLLATSWGSCMGQENYDVHIRWLHCAPSTGAWQADGDRRTERLTRLKKQHTVYKINSGVLTIYNTFRATRAFFEQENPPQTMVYFRCMLQTHNWLSCRCLGPESWSDPRLAASQNGRRYQTLSCQKFYFRRFSLAGRKNLFNWTFLRIIFHIQYSLYF